MASIQLTKRLQIAADIRISEVNHEKLIKHIADRLQFGNENRKQLIEKYRAIDREVAGYLALDDDDKKRLLDRRKGIGTGVTDQILPLTVVQMDEAITFILSIIAPDDGMYSAIAEKGKQDIAEAFALLMNENAKIFEHFRHTAKSLLDMLKYNFGGAITEWRTLKGPRIDNSTSGNPEIKTGVTFSGNSVDAIDPYNFIYDIAVSPIDIRTKGEFFAIPDLVRKFTLRRMAANGEIFGIKDFDSMSAINSSYYEHKPQLSTTHGAAGSKNNWTFILSAGTSNEVQSGFELLTYYGWIIPSEFNLSSSKEAEIWRFTMLNGNQIVAAEHLNNAHGLLPCAIGMPWEDGFDTETKSFAQMLNPYQSFASHQINIHQRASRKALYGVTIYNQRIIPNLDDADMTAAKIPAMPQGQDFDLRKAFHQVTDVPDTSNTIRDVKATTEFMQQVLPTNQLAQIANLERATEYQAAATVQATNRRNFKIAKLTDIQCFSHLRTMQLFNIYQFQETIELTDEAGQLVQIDPSQFRAARLQFDIAAGLKGIDKLIITEGVKDIINMVLQSQTASQQTDIMALIDYFTSMLGDKFDFKQFKIQSPLDNLPPEQKQLAFQLLQQASAQQQQTNGA